MGIDYGKLRSVIAQARREGQDVANNTEDDGTCNLDSVSLRLPRAQETAVLQAFELSGVHGYKQGPGRFLFTVPTGGQANRRSKAQEAATKVLKSHGFQASVFYMMD